LAQPAHSVLVPRISAFGEHVVLAARQRPCAVSPAAVYLFEQRREAGVGPSAACLVRTIQENEGVTAGQ